MYNVVIRFSGILFFVTVIVLTASYGQGVGTGVPGEKPNVVLILMDDAGYETVSYNGALNFSTPNIDALAREGVVFLNCDAQPLCVPSRTKLITGQYNYRNYTGWNSFDLNFPALGSMMKAAGYVTAAFGKWHLSKSPEVLGFDEYSLFDGSPGDLSYAEFFKRYNYNSPLRENTGGYVAPYAPDRFNERALDFIERCKDQPFFLYYPMTLAHNPFEAPPGSSDPRSNNWQENFEKMVAYADSLIGNVVRKLKETGTYENTVIIYTTDNGTKTLSHHMSNGETIYGMKGTHSHDGVHVPLFIKYDGRHRVVDDLVDFADFYPTLADLAGYDTRSLRDQLDGVSLVNVLTRKQHREKPYIFSTYYHDLSLYIRDKRFKLYYDGRLYDIMNDPRELRPHYRQNDTRETARARERLVKGLQTILESRMLRDYPTKKMLEKQFGDYKADVENHFLLAGFILDQLAFVPRSETLRVDISPYLRKGVEVYDLRIAREHRARNSGLSYADASITDVRVLKNGVPEHRVEGDVKLTTRIDHEKLKETGNDLISFLKEGDDDRIPLGSIACAPGDKIELEIIAKVSNPGNQWGDRVMLLFYLDRRTMEGSEL